VTPRLTGTWWLTGRHLRRRWAALVPLALVVALGATGTLVAAGAVDRTAGAYDGYLERADVGDVLLNPSLVTAEVDEVIRDLPGVRSVTSDALFLAGIDEREAAPRTSAELDAEPTVATVRGSVDGRFTAMDRPALSEGRMPTAADEALVTVDLADAQGVELGDVLPLTFWNSRDDLLAEPDDVVSPAGVERVRVVGIATLPDEVLPDDLYPRQRVIVSPALSERYDCVAPMPPVDATREEAAAQLSPRGCSTSYRYYSLEVEGGAAGVAATLAAFQREVAALGEQVPASIAAEGAGYFLVSTTTADERERVERSMQPVVTALGVLAAVVGLVTVVVVGLAVARELRRTEQDQRQWWQLGLAGPERAAVVAVPPLLAVLAGLALAAAAAWWLSPVAPVGSVRSVEPSPSRELSTWAAVAGLALAAACVAILVALSARAARRAQRVEAGRGRLPILPRFVRAPARPDVDQGVRAAYGGRGAGLVLSSCGLAASAFLAAAVFGASLSGLLSTPASYGWRWDLGIMTGFGYGDLRRDAVEETLAARRDVVSWTELGFTNDINIDGEPVLTVLAADLRAGVDVSVVEGRLPQGDREVALGTRTAAARGVGVGDTVELSGGPLDEPRRVTVTGLAVVPPLGSFQADRAGPGNGALLPATFHEGAAGLLTFVGVDLADDSAPRRTLGELHDTLPAWDAFGSPPVEYPEPVRPAEIVNVQSMRAVPLLVGGLLAASAAVGLAVSIVVSVRSRRRELAILRAIGFTGSQVRTSVRVQAVATMAAALAVGVPLGIAVGRVAWRVFAFRLGVVTDPSTPVWWIAATVAGSLLLAVAVAFFPARLASRVDPATTLRTE
jgi:hypothetical protein